jgi:hypothetical protein
VPELERGRTVGGEALQEGLEPRDVLLEVGRELD